MKLYQLFCRNSAIALMICSMIGTTALAQQASPGSTTSDSTSGSTTGSTTPRSTAPGSTTPRSATPGSTTPRSTAPGSTTPRSNNNQGISRDETFSTQDENQQRRSQDAIDRANSLGNRRRTSDSDRSDERPRDTSDDSFDRRRDNRFDPPDDRFEQRDNRFEQRDDRFQQRGDDRFRERDDNFEQGDDRPSTRREGLNRQTDRQQQERSSDRTEVDADVELGASLQQNDQDQLVVSNLSGEGVLANSGIQQGDVIVSVDGNAISSPTDLQRMIAQADSGTRIPVIVMRNGQRQTILLQGRTGVPRWDTNTNIGLNFRTDTSGNLVVSELMSSGLLANSDLRRGDVLVAVDGRPIRSQSDLLRIVRFYDGPRVPVVVLRDGRRQTIYVSIDESRQGAEYRGYTPDDYRARRFDTDRAWLGVYLDTRYQDQAVVEAVEIGSAADRAGLRAGDWIVGVNNQRIQGPTHLSRTVRAMEPGEDLQLEVSRRVTRKITAQLGELPGSHGRFRYDAGDEITRDSNEQGAYRGEVNVQSYGERDRSDR